MRRTRKKSFSELVEQNKEELLKDSKALRKIEDRLEEKHLKKAR